MNLDALRTRCRATALSALMSGAGLLTRLLPIRQPTLLVGPGSSRRLGQWVAGMRYRKLLLVTDPQVAQLGLMHDLTDALRAGGAAFVVFDQVTPDAPIPVIEQGIRLARSQECDALLAIGGGSAIDAAKAMSVALANPHRPVSALAGYFKGWNRPLPLYAVPTTAGTGSEVTVAAVVSDPVRRRKCVIVDTRLVPRIAALDPALMTSLPPGVTAATGIDALTHAVEAFIGTWATPATDGVALLAVELVFKHLRTACRDGGQLEARESMALASTYAGLAFTRANVGHVHAIAHQFGSRFHTPHGLANAIVLPQVLRFYLGEVHQASGSSRPQRHAVQPRLVERLARLAQRAGLGEAGDSDPALAAAFIVGVEALIRDIGLPSCLEALRESDIPALARAARHEADTRYPVPRYMSQSECEAIVRALLPGSAAQRSADSTPAAGSPRMALTASSAATIGPTPWPASNTR